MTRLTDKKLLNEPRKALGAFNSAISTGLIEESTLELVKIRASQINGCAICLTTHWKAALALGERVDRLSTVVCWREAGWFTAREMAALEWCEKVTLTGEGHVSDADYQAAREQFTQEEMVELTMVIISINSWNRINIAFGSPPMNFGAPEQAAKPEKNTAGNDESSEADAASPATEGDGQEPSANSGEAESADSAGEEDTGEEEPVTATATEESETDKAVEYEDNEE